MTRSTSRATVSPSHRTGRFAVPRPLAGAALAVAAGLLLTGCSVGQIAETARKNPSVPGANAEKRLTNADGQIIGTVAVRDVVVAYRNPAGYQRGGQAPLEARVFNDTTGPVTVRVTVGEPPAASGQIVAAESVVLVDDSRPSAAPDAPGGSAEPNRPESPTGSPAVGSPAVGSPAAGRTAEPDGTASPAGSTAPDDRGKPAPATGGPATFEIPAGGFVVLSEAGGRYLRLTGLDDRLAPGMSVPLRFEFNAGEQVVELTVSAPMTNPLSPPGRATPDTEELQGGH